MRIQRQMGGYSARTSFKEWGALVIFSLAVTLLSGCGFARLREISTSTAHVDTLVITGPDQVEAATNTSFYAEDDNGILACSSWKINGIPGGNRDLGLISPTGIYTAPTVQQNVTVSCIISSPNVQVASHALKIVPVVPSISSGSAMQGKDGTAVIDILGIGFSSASTLFVDNVAVRTDFISPRQVRSFLANGGSVARNVTVAIRNSFPVQSTSNSIEISIPQTDDSVLAASTLPSEMIGCENPNTGTSNGEWGPDDSSYIDVTTSLELIGSPVYTHNTIFWSSQETAPGGSILLTGAFTSLPKKARLARIPPGLIEWHSLINDSTIETPVTQMGVTGLAIRVPPTMPPGVYGFEIVDPSAEPVFGIANAPSISWFEGVPAAKDPETALQHSVYSCAAEAGQAVRIFGRNFDSSQHLVMRSLSGRTYDINPSFVDSNSLSAPLPSNIEPGSYIAWIGNRTWDAISSEAIVLTVVQPLTYHTNTVFCNSLIKDQEIDNSTLLQKCLDDSAPIDGSSQITYVAVPSGRFMLSKGITLHPYEVLIGNSTDSTIFFGEPEDATTSVWIMVPKHVGLVNFTFRATLNPYLLESSDLSGNPATSGSIFISGIRLEAMEDLSDGHERIATVYGPDVQIYDSVLQTSVSGPDTWAEATLSLGYADGAIVSGNTLINTNAAAGAGNSQNVIFEHNSAYSAEGPGEHGGMAFGVARAFTNYGPTLVTQNIYVGYNNFHDIGWPNQQAVTTDGGGSAYFGYVAESTANTVTLSNDPSWIWTGMSYPKGIAVEIVSGMGVGQVSLVQSIDGRRITLTRSWEVPPDSSSIVQITNPKINLTYSHNQITDAMGTAILVYGGGLNTLIEDNVLTDAGEGIQVWGYGVYGGPADYFSTFNTEVLRNRLEVGSGKWIVSSINQNVAGIGIGDQPGCVVSGLLIRDNVVPFNQTIFNTNGSNGISANLIEQNTANTYSLSSRWFLVRDNKPVQIPAQ